jgi:gliding motility-associated-like protein
LKKALIIICTLFQLIAYGQIANSVQTFPSGVNSHAHTTVYDPVTGDVFVGGSKGDSAFVSRLDAANNVLWAKSLGTLYQNQINSTVTTLFLTGDTLVGCGFTQSGVTDFDGGFVFKMNASTGELYWFKGEITSNVYFSTIIPSGGQYIISGANRTAFPNTSCDFLAVSASDGTILWQSDQLDLYFITQGINHVDDIMITTELRDGFFYSTGRAYVTISNQMRAFVIKMSATGEVIWKKYFMYPETVATRRFYGLDIEYISNDRLLLAVGGDPVCSGSCNNFQMGLVELDTSGTVIWSKLYNHSSPAEFIRYAEVINNGFRVVAQTNITSTTGKNLLIFETDFTGNVTTVRQLSKPGFNCEVNLGGYANLCGEAGNEGNFTVTPFSVKNTSGTPQINQLTVLKISDLSSLSSDCFTIEPATLTTTVVPPYSNDLFADESPNPVAFNLVAPANNSVLNTPCPTANMGITVADSSCTSYTLTTLAAAQYQVLWSTGSTASTISATATGSYWLQVYNPVTCCYYYDTVIVTIDPETPVVDLQDPGLLCLNAGESYVLTPFVTYLGSESLEYSWNDGSTAAEFVANTSGWVSVSVTNGCVVVEDSIYLNVQNPVSIEGQTMYALCPGQTAIVQPTVQNEGQIVWSNGASGTTQSFSVPGSYFVAALNSCGSDTVYFEIEQEQLPQISLPADFDTCASTAFLINSVPVNASNVFWNDGSQQTSLLVSSSGIYWVVAVNQCGQDQDSIFIQIDQAPPSVQLNVPSFVCINSGDNFEIVPSYAVFNPQSDEINWSNGSTSQTITVTSGGTYWLTVENNCGLAADTVTFEIHPYLEITGPGFVEECVEPSVSVSVQMSGSETVLWSDGQTSNPGVFTSSGTYFAIVSNQCGADTLVTVVQIGEMPDVNLPSFIDTCSGFGGILLDSGHNGIGNVLWSTGATSSEVLVNNSGAYWVSASNLCGTDADTVFVSIDAPESPVIMTSVADPSCELNIILAVQGCDPAQTPVWNTGDTTCWIEVQQSGLYVVSVENSCGVFSDTLEIGMLGEGQIYVPNSFTPNGDEFNNSFRINIGDCYDPYYFEFRIYNRWGEMVFKSSDPEFDWDGTHKERMCQDGTYTWTMDLKRKNNDEKFKLNGHVNILK